MTATSVRLTWSSGNLDPVESYIVQYKPKYDGTYTDIPNVMDTEYRVENLKAYLLYEFRVVAVNNIGRGLTSSPVDVTTKEMR